MFEAKKDYVLLSNVHDDRLRFGVVFPSGVPVERIGVNTKRLGLLFRIGGISQFIIKNSDQDTVEKISYQIGGVDSSGGAVATNVAKVETYPYSQSDQYYPEESPNLSHTGRWRRAILEVNIGEMAQRISRDKRNNEGIRSTQLWTSYLDLGVKGTILKVGMKNLLTGYHKNDLVQVLLCYGLPTLPMLNTFLVNQLGGKETTFNMLLADFLQLYVMARVGIILGQLGRNREAKTEFGYKISALGVLILSKTFIQRSLNKCYY